MQIPLNDLRVLMHVAQSESPYATAMVASCCGRSLRRRSWRLLLIVGSVPVGSSCRG